MTSLSTQPLHVEDLGRLGYGPALAYQRQVNEAVIAGDRPATLLLVEHEPVITVTRRPGARDHVLVSRDRLARLGIEVHETDRGGDVTYHGPGQLVAYPILRLAPHRLNLSTYMRLLEQVVIDTLAAWGVAAFRVHRCTGVWVSQGQAPADTAACDATAPRAKICAMGVRIRRNTTMHGLALNVSPAMEHFQTIVPCGIAEQGVTSLAQRLGEATPTMDEVKTELVRTMRAALTSWPESRRSTTEAQRAQR